jgi:hypothetical protein
MHVPVCHTAALPLYDLYMSLNALFLVNNQAVYYGATLATHLQNATKTPLRVNGFTMKKKVQSDC